MSNNLKASIALEGDPIKGPMRDEELSSFLKASQDKSFTLDPKLNPKEGSFHSKSLLDIAIEAEKRQEIIEKEKNDKSLKKNEEADKIEKEELKTDNSSSLENINDKQKNIENTDSEDSNNQSEEVAEDTNKFEKKTSLEKTLSPEEKENKKSVSEELLKVEVDKAYNKGLEEGKLLGISESREQLSDGIEVATVALREIVDNLKHEDQDILENIKTTLFDKVKEISGELAGRIIHSLPKDYANRLSNLANVIVDRINDLTIHINPQDFDSINNSEEASKILADINFKADESLKRGDAKIIVGGIEIKDIAEDRLRSKHNLPQDKKELKSNLEDVSSIEDEKSENLDLKSNTDSLKNNKSIKDKDNENEEINAEELSTENVEDSSAEEIQVKDKDNKNEEINTEELSTENVEDNSVEKIPAKGKDEEDVK